MSSRRESSREVSCCNKCCQSLKSMQVQFLNIIDFFVGCALVSFTGYLSTTLGLDKFQDPSSSWLGWGCGILGALLLIISLLGFCAMMISTCRWAMIPSRWLSLLVFLAMLALAITCEIKKKIFFDFVEDSQGNGITQEDVDSIKKYFVLFNYILFAMSALQLYRFIITRNYRQEQLRIDGEYEALLEEDEKVMKEKLESKDKARSEKYEDLRAYYKNKYSRDNAQSNSSASPNSKV